MAHRSKLHTDTIHLLINVRDKYFGAICAEALNRSALAQLYRETLDSFYERVMYISADCQQWLKAAHNFKQAGDMIGYASCMENYKHYHDRKIQLTNKQLF